MVQHARSAQTTPCGPRHLVPLTPDFVCDCCSMAVCFELTFARTGISVRGSGDGLRSSNVIAYDALPMTPLSLSVRVERWPIAGTFAISRGAKTEAVVVVAELTDGRWRGRGECVPYGRYGETAAAVATAIEASASDLAAGLDRERLQAAMPPGAARNALDCAFWDLAAKRA